MAEPKILSIYLDDTPRESAEAGQFNIFNKIKAAFEGQGFRVEYRRNSTAERLKSATRRGYSLFHMDDPIHPRALTLRRAYFYPFWRIEVSAKRWEWEIAKTPFDPGAVDAAEATRFCNYWRNRLFDTAANTPRRDGFIFVPLQGRLLDQRSFQSASPIEMVRTVLQQDPSRRVIATLHPNETYTPQELEAVGTLAGNQPRLEIATCAMTDLLATCDYVVTENSSAALNGFFFHKPAILFARIDFHHIAASVPALGVKRAFHGVQTLNPDYDRYLWWFLKGTAINGGSDQTEAQILDTVRRHGWTV